MVIWIIGKSGVGKTFLGKHLLSILKKKTKKIVWVDGDRFRKRYSKDLKYTLKDRKENSKRVQKYCKKLEKDNLIVICSILSIFKEHQKKNRNFFKQYFQVYINANQKKLIQRNNKKIYSKKKDVVGKDINFPKPYNSDMVIKNTFNKSFLNNLNILEKKIYKNLNFKN